MSQAVPARSSMASHEGQGSSVTMGVADEHIGAVVGRGGRNIMEISQVCIVYLVPQFDLVFSALVQVMSPRKLVILY